MKEAKKQIFKSPLTQNGLNPDSEQFKSKMQNGAFQRDPEGSNYHGSKEAAKAKNIFNNFK